MSPTYCNSNWINSPLKRVEWVGVIQNVGRKEVEKNKCGHGNQLKQQTRGENNLTRTCRVLAELWPWEHFFLCCVDLTVLIVGNTSHFLKKMPSIFFEIFRFLPSVLFPNSVEEKKVGCVIWQKHNDSYNPWCFFFCQPWDVSKITTAQCLDTQVYMKFSPTLVITMVFMAIQSE